MGNHQTLSAERQRMVGLDAIRFFCALVVTVGHIGVPWGFIWGMGLPFSEPVRMASGLLINGPAAVIVFFVVSGLCIHYPTSNGAPLMLREYYTRRFIRIGVPAVVAASAWVYIKGTPASWWDTVFWSVFCEVTYYLLYPLILQLKQRYGWRPILSTAFVISFVLAALNVDVSRENYNSYVSLGAWTIVVGLPCWVLGCVLADYRDKFSTPSKVMIWLVRFFVLFVSSVLMIVRFHTDTVISGNVITLNIFALLVFLWIGFELKYGASHAPSRILERAGSWSYSLYLTHPLAHSIALLFGLGGILDGAYTKNIVVLILSLGFAYIFFLLVENPAHNVAKSLAGRFRLGVGGVSKSGA